VVRELAVMTGFKGDDYAALGRKHAAPYRRAGSNAS